LFEYHDEPLAASSKLPHKVPENIIRKRFLQLDTIVDQQITTKEHARKGQTETGFVMNIKSATRDPHSAILLVVRPALHAPEMDPYDTITLEQITKVFNDT
jgi:tRNA A37 methylthiotransferase MiaB